MNIILTAVRRGLLLTKRLYKKALFVLLMLLIPVLVIGYNNLAQEDSGMVTIALASKSTEKDELYNQVVEDLKESDLVLFISCDDPEEAKHMAITGKANAAWIFNEDLRESLYSFMAKRNKRNYIVTVYETEESVTNYMVREMLSGVLFPYGAEKLYLDYVREKIPELRELTDQQLMEYYRESFEADDLFLFTDIDGNVRTEEQSETYLTAPIRGILGVIIALSGLASSIFFLQDKETGTFSYIATKYSIAVELGCQLICVTNVTLAAVVAIRFCGRNVPLGEDIITALLYILCVSVFGMLVRRLSGGIRGLAMITPLLVVAMLVICPVFIDLGRVRGLQYFLPPTYFVNGPFSNRYLIFMALYSALGGLICVIIDKMKIRKNN